MKHCKDAPYCITEQKLEKGRIITIKHRAMNEQERKIFDADRKATLAGKNHHYQFDDFKRDWGDYFSKNGHKKFKKEVINIDKYGNITYLIIPKTILKSESGKTV